MSSDILEVFALGQPPWRTLDPFLFCVHHRDHYPQGDAALGIANREKLRGRNMGSDFSGREGFSMYHGQHVPGFPQHPHRGFETVTLARDGYIDHSDSLGAKARFGHGDAQWLTAGKGIVHCEMFPLVKSEADNPTELFQIWLNLPRRNKMVDPYFTMLWGEDIPVRTTQDSHGRKTELTVVAGPLGDITPPPPPPDSWASQDGSHVAIWALKLEADAHFRLPGDVEGLNRVLYVFEGAGMTIGGQHIANGHGVVVRSDADLEIVNGDAPAEILMLQGRPIGEPVAAYGPFVMNTGGEIRQAMMDYQRTRFGGWPFTKDDPVHGKTQGRFARHADGTVEERDA